jgi:CRISPR/Cas system-associated exonuclease Cas4 (RecB family)
MVVDEDRTWIAFEESFGGDDAPVLLPLADGALRIQGKIDRVDRTADGELIVVDYKTGRTHQFRHETGTYAGGRRLQHAFYTAGAEALHELPVRAVEYHFPGEKGRNERVVYRRGELEGAVRLVEHLVAIAANGWFVPTENAREDCKFCDVRHVCRVAGENDSIDSPLAAWSAEQLDSDADALRALRQLRTW